MTNYFLIYYLAYIFLEVRLLLSFIIYLNKINDNILLSKLNKLLSVIGITIVSILLAGSFIIATENVYKNQSYGQGYNIVEVKDSKEATEEEEDAMEEADDDDD